MPNFAIFTLNRSMERLTELKKTSMCTDLLQKPLNGMGTWGSVGRVGMESFPAAHALGVLKDVLLYSQD